MLKIILQNGYIIIQTLILQDLKPYWLVKIYIFRKIYSFDSAIIKNVLIVINIPKRIPRYV